MKPKISIIVPIYNAQQQLERCIHSLMKQTFQDLEIILVNDGSTDRSLEMIREFEKQDERIMVINQENNGVSAARNQGLVVSSGKYIGFVDADDWIDLNMYERLYGVAEEKEADIVMCTYVREFIGGSKEKKFMSERMVHLEGRQVQTNLLRRLMGPIRHELAQPEMLDAWGTVWSKLYRADLLRKSQASFKDLNEIGTNEDLLFNMQVISDAKSFVFLNEPLYHYWKGNEISVTNSHKPNLLKKWLRLFHYIERLIAEKQNEGAIFYVAYQNRICISVLGLGLNELYAKDHTHRQKIRALKKILNSKLIDQSMKGLDFRYLPFIWRVFFWSAKYKQSYLLYALLHGVEMMRKRKGRRGELETITHSTSSNDYESRWT